MLCYKAAASPLEKSGFVLNSEFIKCSRYGCVQIQGQHPPKADVSAVLSQHRNQGCPILNTLPVRQTNVIFFFPKSLYPVMHCKPTSFFFLHVKVDKARERSTALKKNLVV